MNGTTVKRHHNYIRTAVLAAPIVLLIANVGLVLWKVHSVYFISVPIWQYITIIWGAISAIIAFASGVGPAVRICRAVFTGREGPQSVSVDRVILTSSNAVVRLLK